MSKRKRKSIGIKSFTVFIFVMIALGVIFKDDVISFLDEVTYYIFLGIGLFILAYIVYRGIKAFEDKRRGYGDY